MKFNINKSTTKEVKVNFKKMEEEFNLSERIYQLKKELKEYAKLNDTQIDGIIRLIIFMDKEFIKRDTKLIVEHWNDKSIEELLNRRRKLAGNNLI